MNKKAQLSLQFNWIFILIIGVAILAFFLVTIRSQSKSADMDLTADIMKNLDTVIKSAEASTGAEKIIHTPSLRMNFVCDNLPLNNIISTYTIGGFSDNDLTYDMIFTQEELSGNQLISWTQSWNMPFRIALFQYLTTKRSLFIIVNNTGTPAAAIYINKTLPKNIQKIIVNPSDSLSNYTGFDYYKIIELGMEHVGAGKPPGMYHTVYFEEVGKLKSEGKVHFSIDVTEEGISAYNGPAMLFGAIFAQDMSFYECTSKKALARLKLLMNLTKQRTLELSTESTNAECKSIYDSALIEISALESITEFTPSSYGKTINIKNRNERLIRGDNCALIY